MRIADDVFFVTRHFLSNIDLIQLGYTPTSFLVPMNSNISSKRFYTIVFPSVVTKEEVWIVLTMEKEMYSGVKNIINNLFWRAVVDKKEKYD